MNRAFVANVACAKDTFSSESKMALLQTVSSSQVLAPVPKGHGIGFLEKFTDQNTSVGLCLFSFSRFSFLWHHFVQWHQVKKVNRRRVSRGRVGFCVGCFPTVVGNGKKSHSSLSGSVDAMPPSQLLSTTLSKVFQTVAMRCPTLRLPLSQVPKEAGKGHRAL